MEGAKTWSRIPILIPLFMDAQSLPRISGYRLRTKRLLSSTEPISEKRSIIYVARKNLELTDHL